MKDSAPRSRLADGSAARDGSTGDEPLRRALMARDTRVEHRLNLVRGVVLVPLMLADLLYGWLAGILHPPLVAAWALALLGFVAYFLVVDRATRGPSYRPWLKYTTVTIDTALAVALYHACRRVDFMVRAAPVDGVAIFVGFLLLLNVLSAFRHGRAIVAYSTLLSSGAALYLAATYTTSTALIVYAPALVVSCGILAYSLSASMTQLFARTQRRQWLMRFLPHGVIDGVERGEISLDPGGVKRDVTVLLADLRGFTTFAEGRDAYEVVAMLNDHFARMADVIWRHGGMIDKFVGDAILAVFGLPVGEPDDAVRAVRAALEMQRVLGAQAHDADGAGTPPLAMGIALHSGVVVAGNVGTDRRLEYTIIGDVVNVAARIEELNKVHGTAILMSGATQARVRDAVPARSVGEVAVRGRSRPIALFAPIEERAEAGATAPGRQASSGGSA